MTFIDLSHSLFVQSDVRTLYIYVYKIVSSFRYQEVELDILFHTSCIMLQYNVSICV